MESWDGIQMEIEEPIPIVKFDEPPESRRKPADNKKSERQAKNRESARNSRKRKKAYLKMLEQKVENLTEERNNLKRDQLINNFTSSENVITNGFHSGKQALFSLLKEAIEGNTVDTEIDALLDQVRQRMGSQGSDRHGTIEYFFSQIIDIVLPVHVKYLLWISQEGRDIFEDGTQCGISGEGLLWDTLVSDVSLNPDQNTRIWEYRNILQAERGKFSKCINGLNQIRSMMQKRTCSLQHIIDHLRTFLAPRQVAKFLIYIDEHKSLPGQAAWDLAPRCAKSTSKEDLNRASSDSSYGSSPPTSQPGSMPNIAGLDVNGVGPNLFEVNPQALDPTLLKIEEEPLELSALPK